MVKGILLLCALLLALINVPFVHAQQAGFGIGVAPFGAAPFGVAPMIGSPVQPFMSAPVQPFFSSPVQPFVTAPVQPFVSSPVQPFVTSPVTPFGVHLDPFPGQFTPGFGVLPGQSIPVPGPVQPLNPIVLPEPFIGAAPGFVGGQPVVSSPQLIIPGSPAFVPSQVGAPIPGPVTFPAIGTARAEVLRQFGQPQVIIATTDGETMLFPNDVSIFLRNGVVAAPR